MDQNAWEIQTKTEQFSSLIQSEINNFATLIFLFVGYMESREQQIWWDEDFLSVAVDQPTHAREKAHRAKPDGNLSTMISQ